MKKSQISIIVIILVLLVVTAGAIYYFSVRKETELHKEFNHRDLIVFEVKDTNLPQSRQEEYFQRFLKIREVLRKYPDAFDTWLELGGLHKLIGNYEMAEKTWIYAGEIRPQNSPSFANLGDLYTNFLKDYPKAEAAFLVAIENSEGEAFNINYTRQLFELYFYHLEDNQKSEKFLLERLAKYPDDSELISLLAFLYSRTDQVEKAVEYYEKLLVLDPNNEAARRELEQLKGSQ